MASTTALLLVFIGSVFWYQDLQYSLPTPRPSGLLEPPLGSRLAAPVGVKLPKSRPTLLHFFNPGCPCSRFNLEHVRRLIDQYSSKVTFVAVLRGEAPAEELLRQYSKLNLNAPAIVDTDGSLAGSAGVYSTPQAVLLDARHQLYYRGNYNASRYCANRDTEYARIAIDALLGGRGHVQAPERARIAYGCPLKRPKV